MRTTLMARRHLRQIASGLFHNRAGSPLLFSVPFIGLLLGAVLAAPHCVLAQTASISDVGLEGFLPTGGTPTRVRIRLSNPTNWPVTINLTISVAQKDAGVNNRRVDQFMSSEKVGPGESRLVSLPISLWATVPVLSLEARTSDGHEVGQQTRILNRANSNLLVALLCAEEKTCNQVLGALESSGDDTEKAAKTKTYTFLVLKDLEDNWWEYLPAHGLVLARPNAGLSEKQRLAIEGYCRQQGQLVVLDNLAGPGLLEAYRNTKSGSYPRDALGAGYFYRFADAEAFASFLDRSVHETSEWKDGHYFRQFTRYRANVWDINQGHRLATMFEFPTFRWLILWLIVYVVVVGAVNFYVLTKINRRELAWITVPAIALAFALMLYLMGTAKRPTKIGLDDIATYQLDDHTTTASATYDVRVSSPRRQDLTLRVPGNVLWTGVDHQISPFASFSIFDRQTADLKPGWKVRMAAKNEFDIPLLQWSYQDVSLFGLASLPGTIKRVPGGRLVNQTGLTFRQGVFRDGEKVYDLQRIAAGAEFDPRNGPMTDLNEETRRFRLEPEKQFDRNSHEDVRSLLINQSRSDRPSFVGLAEALALGSELPGQDATHHQYVIVVVSLWGAP